MTQKTSKAVTTYRWIVFLLALGYFILEFFTTGSSDFGWQFRYLTIWGLTANLVVAAMMLRYSLGLSEKTYNPFVSASVVLGVVVVFMYWKLYFTDPKLVNGDSVMPWYQEYYLHLGSQILMMIDAFFILGAFRRLGATFVVMLVIFLAYIGWTELLVQPLNIYPEGSATSGLPYPFLNDMQTIPRMIFYATTIGTGVVIMLIGWGVSRFISRARD